MTHTDVIPTSASIASTGSGIRYIQNWAYAYSGEVTTSGADVVNTLDFNSGSGLIKAKISFGIAGYTAGSDDFRVAVTMNGETIFQVLFNNIEPARLVDASLLNLEIIIPPQTTVTTTAKRAYGSGTATFTTLITGRVYGAE